MQQPPQKRTQAAPTIEAVVRFCEVAHLLNDAGYSLQGNRKTLEGATHPDRNTQFEYINAKVKPCLSG